MRLNVVALITWICFLPGDKNLKLHEFGSELIKSGNQNLQITECLSPISDMDFQFWVIWAAQGSRIR